MGLTEECGMNIHSVLLEDGMTRADEKREAILAAALSLFAERGFHGTSVPDLAKKAGVGTGTIYRYFDNKEALVNVLYQHWKLRLLEATVGALPEGESWRARFRILWHALVDFSLEHPGAIEFLDLQHHASYLDEPSKAIEAQSAAAFLMLVQQGQAEEVFTPLESPALVGMVYSAFVGLMRAAREGWVELTPELVAAAEERAWAMIRR